MSIFSFNTDLTATEGTDYTFTVTPNAALTEDHTVRWEIILDGKLPAGFGDFKAISGEVEFTAGMSGDKTITLPIINDAVREYAKTFSIRLTQIDSSNVEVQIGEDQQITLMDDDTSAAFSHIDLPATGQHDTLVAGSSYTYRSFNGSGGDDTMIITRFQTGDITINDIIGQNIIKFDHGVQITAVEEKAGTGFTGVRTVNSIDITLDTGAVITISNPNIGAAGSKRYSFQIGDGVLTDYDGFVAAITAGGFAAGNKGSLITPFDIAYPVADDSIASTETSTEILFTASLSGVATEGAVTAEGADMPYEFTVTPNAVLTADYTVRWEIILDGQLPAGFNDFSALSGEVIFTSGSSVAQTISFSILDDTARGDVKSFSVRLTQINADDQEVQIGEDQRITLIDNDMGDFTSISLANSTQDDTLVAGSSYEYLTFSGGAGNDTMIITRFQTGDVSINDGLGQNIIKFDHGVGITAVEQDVFEIPNVIRVVRSITITLETGAVIKITTPDNGLVGGGKQYSFQLGDGVLTDYDDFYAAITSGGFATGNKGALTTPYDIEYPAAGDSTASADVLFKASLADTATEETAFSFMVTPNMALTADYTVRWDIILEGQLSANFGDFTALSGEVTFANGATVGQAITLPILNDVFREEAKTFSVRLTQIASDTTEVQIGEDQQVTLSDTDAATAFSHISLPSTGEHDTLVAGSSYTYRSFNGAGGNDTMIITRFQAGDITIDDALGRNVIKFDHGVQITGAKENLQVSFVGLTITSIVITLDSGANIEILNPDIISGIGNRYSFQIGDGVLTDYADFYAAITSGGLADADTGVLNTPFDIAYPTAGDSTASTGASLFTASLADTATEETTFSFMVTPNTALTADYTVRWDIILEGQLPANFGDFTALSGEVTFANGATVGRAITLPILNDVFREEAKTFSVRLTQIAPDTTEVQIGEDQQVTLSDTDAATAFSHISLPATGQHDTLVAGSSYTYRSFNGAGGNDTMIITRFQTGDITINDALGQNVIKFDHGVQITGAKENSQVSFGGLTITSIVITLDSGAVIEILNPDIGSGIGNRYSFQLGDGVLTDYADFYAAITSGGFADGGTDVLNTPFDIAYPSNAEAVDITLPIPRDALTYAFTKADFININSGDIMGITILSPPTGFGYLTLDGAYVSGVREIAADDISSLVYYKPIGGTVPLRGLDVTFQFSLTLEGGESSNASTLTLDLMAESSPISVRDGFANRFSLERNADSPTLDQTRDFSEVTDGQSRLVITQSGNDNVTGTDLDDAFNLGLGNDTVTGGGGNDAFIHQVGLSSTTNSLTITDFEFGRDRLVLVDNGADLLGDAFYDLTIGTDVEVELFANNRGRFEGLKLTIGANDVITLNFADDSIFVAEYTKDFKEFLGLADDVTLDDYFLDDSERIGTQYVFTQMAFTKEIFDELLGFDGIEVLQDLSEIPVVIT